MTADTHDRRIVMREREREFAFEMLAPGAWMRAHTADFECEHALNHLFSFEFDHTHAFESVKHVPSSNSVCVKWIYRIQLICQIRLILN